MERTYDYTIHLPNQYLLPGLPPEDIQIVILSISSLTQYDLSTVSSDDKLRQMIAESKKELACGNHHGRIRKEKKH